MKRNSIHYISGHNTPPLPNENIFFHEAGHAAAIFLNNKAKDLPPVFFQIILNTLDNEQETNPSHVTDSINTGYVAKIEGGRLVQSFPPAQDINEAYLVAFETDIINILIGPLSEARYVHQCDNEFFNERIVNLHALNYYGGKHDLALVNEYLHSLYSDKQQQKDKLHQLFSTAFEFVQDDNNWQAISRLANYIYRGNKNIITYEEIESILETIETQLASNYLNTAYAQKLTVKN